MLREMPLPYLTSAHRVLPVVSAGNDEVIAYLPLFNHLLTRALACRNLRS